MSLPKSPLADVLVLTGTLAILQPIYALVSFIPGPAPLNLAEVLFRYAIPYTTALWMQASRAGVFRGHACTTHAGSTLQREIAERVQSFQAHTRWFPPFHFFVAPILLLNVLNELRHLVMWPALHFAGTAAVSSLC